MSEKSCPFGYITCDECQLYIHNKKNRTYEGCVFIVMFKNIRNIAQVVKKVEKVVLGADY